MSSRHRIKNEAVIVGYAMARLDRALLDAMGWATWTQACDKVAKLLDENPNSISMLRDEFDVFFPNERKGWRNRMPHPSRIPILHEFSSVSDAALVEFVKSILSGDQATFEEVVGLVSEPPKRVANVAERLLTGKLAEEHFMRTCQEIVDVPPDALRDMRQRACGYDFETTTRPDVAIEVKGMKATKGGILFTDREWTEAQYRGPRYWLVIVGQLDQSQYATPQARVVPDPATVFQATARCNVVQSAAAQWGVTVTL